MSLAAVKNIFIACFHKQQSSCPNFQSINLANVYSCPLQMAYRNLCITKYHNTTCTKCNGVVLLLTRLACDPNTDKACQELLLLHLAMNYLHNVALYWMVPGNRTRDGFFLTCYGRSSTELT